MAIVNVVHCLAEGFRPQGDLPQSVRDPFQPHNSISVGEGCRLAP